MEKKTKVIEEGKKKKKKKGGLKLDLDSGGEVVTVGEQRQKFSEWLKEREKKTDKA